jgi:hypothetical protein
VILKDGSEFTSGFYDLIFKSVRSYDLKLVLSGGPGKILAAVHMPRQFVQLISSVEGRITRRKQKAG